MTSMTDANAKICNKSTNSHHPNSRNCSKNPWKASLVIKTDNFEGDQLMCEIHVITCDFGTFDVHFQYVFQTWDKLLHVFTINR